MPQNIPSETVAARPRGDWLRSMLSGKDNQSIAIGRVLGLLLFLNLLMALPIVVASVLWLQKVEPKTWFEYLNALQVYVPLIIVATAGVISGTAFTEPHGSASTRETVTAAAVVTSETHNP